MKIKKKGENEFYKELKSKSDIPNDKLYSPQAIAKSLMHFAGFDYTYFSFISPDDMLDYLINYVIELLDDDFTNNLKKKISHKSFTLGVGQCSNGKLLTTSCARTYSFRPSKNDMKKNYLMKK